jgi:hypothetical protein
VPCGVGYLLLGLVTAMLQVREFSTLKDHSVCFSRICDCITQKFHTRRGLAGLDQGRISSLSGSFGRFGSGFNSWILKIQEQRTGLKQSLFITLFLDSRHHPERNVDIRELTLLQCFRSALVFSVER